MRNKPTPEVFRELPWAKQVDMVTKLYITLCTNEVLFTKKGLGKSYFGLRHFFMKSKRKELSVTYDYLYSFNKNKPMTLTEFIHGTERFRIRRITQDNKANIKPAQEYAEFNMGDLEGLL